MIDVEKRIEEVMRKVEFMRGAAQFGSPCELDAARKDVEATIRTMLSSAQSGEQAPYAVLTREIGESDFFDHKPVKPNSVHHLHAKQSPYYDYVELYTHPAPAMEVVNEWEGIESLPVCDDLIWLYCQDTNTIDGPIEPCPSFVDSWTHWAYANAPSTAVIDASQPNGEAK